MSEPSPPVIAVLVADDDEDQRVLLRHILAAGEGARHDVTLARDGTEALRELRERVFDVALLDLSMPGLSGIEVLEAIAGDPARPQVVFVSGKGTVATATRAMKLGAYDFLEKPVDGARLLTLVWKAAHARRLLARSELLGAAVSRDARGVRIVTRDPSLREVLALAARVAQSDVSVLVGGESGTGKELVAREIHRLSGRDAAPLVALNCAAVSEALAESELFGHEKGAFTGAGARKIGLVEMADGGTLFLDEIGEMTPALQAKLLRTLEGKRFRRVGGVKELPANFRLVSATNRPLSALVEEGSFRSDLFYRINAVVLELPPLREREGDVLLLARHFLDEIRPGADEPWTLAADAAELLEGYDWPGNVRELRNVVERAALLARDRTIRAADLGSSVGPGAGAGERRRSPADGVGAAGRDEDGTGGSAAAGPTLPSLRLERLEKLAVTEALARTGWHRGRAAELLGVSVRTLHRKIGALGLRPPDGRE